LLGYGLAGADGVRDESVPIAKRTRQLLVNVSFERDHFKMKRSLH
jgi:hypothetical protein